MVRFLSTFRLKPGVEPDEAVKLWHSVHVPNVLKGKEYGLKKYVISRILSAPDAKPDFFGMVELYFDDLETAKKCMKFLSENVKDKFGESITDSRRVFVVEEERIL